MCSSWPGLPGAPHLLHSSTETVLPLASSVGLGPRSWRVWGRRWAGQSLPSHPLLRGLTSLLQPQETPEPHLSSQKRAQGCQGLPLRLGGHACL